MIVDNKDWKYLEEKYPLAWNMTKRLRDTQTLISATVSVEDSNGRDVTSDIIDTTSITTTHPRVFVTFKKNGGVRGKRYLVKVIAVTSEDEIEQTLEMEVR